MPRDYVVVVKQLKGEWHRKAIYNHTLKFLNVLKRLEGTAVPSLSR